MFRVQVSINAIIYGLFHIKELINYIFFILVFCIKVKPLFSQVFSRRPINNPIAGRCY